VWLEMVVNSSKHGKGHANSNASRVVSISMTLRPATEQDIAMSKHLSGADVRRVIAVLEYRDTGVGI